MSKKKPAADAKPESPEIERVEGDDLPGPDTLRIEAGDEASELEALRAQLAAAQSRITELESKPPAAAACEPGRFLVRLDGAPAWVVDAPSPSQAWDAYKAATGVINSIHEPSVSRVAADCPLGRHAA